MPTVEGAAQVDIFVTVVCGVLLWRYAKLTVWHPACIIFAAHLYVVTSRLVQLNLGRHPMRVPDAFSWPVGMDEVVRAGIASDLALAAMTCAWLISARATSKTRQKARPGRLHRHGHVLSPTRIRIVAALAFLIGMLGIFTIGRRFETAVFLDPTAWSTSGYVRATLTWPTWAACLLHYVEGFPVWLTCSTAGVFLFVALNNFSRFSVVLGLLFLIYTRLSLTGARRFPAWFLPAGVALWALWFPMKYIVEDVNEGKSFAEMRETVAGYFSNELGSEAGGLDTQFLDMTASAMTLADLNGRLFWGATVQPVLVGPIPRALWVDKPRINEYVWEISIPARQMGRSQMTVGLVGEGYINLRYPGVFILGFAIAYLYSAVYARVIHVEHRSAQRLLYAFLLVSLLQVYRDGLSSIVWFPLVHAAPISLAALWHWLWPVKLAARRPHLAAAGLSEMAAGRLQA